MADHNTNTLRAPQRLPGSNKGIEYTDQESEASEWASDTPPALTPREVQVLELVAKGYTNKQIAITLHITIHTVKAHMGRIMRKLGAESRAAAVATWLRSRHSTQL